MRQDSGLGARGRGVNPSRVMTLAELEAMFGAYFGRYRAYQIGLGDYRKLLEVTSLHRFKTQGLPSHLRTIEQLQLDVLELCSHRRNEI